MPSQKDLKRIVRSRMLKTGESYTAARRQVVEKKPPAESASAAASVVPDPPPDYAAAAGMSDEALTRGTGQAWEHWVRILDTFGAASRPHREIAAHLAEIGVPGWWSQMVAVGYERIRGLRAIGQRRGGSWEANKSRTFSVPVATLYKAFSDARSRKRWLGDEEYTLRKGTAHKTLRLAWGDGSLVQIYFVPKGEAKTQVAVQHVKLDSKDQADARKAFWSERFDRLAALL